MKCLKCGREFASAGAHNRLCRKCGDENRGVSLRDERQRDTRIHRELIRNTRTT